MELESFTVRRGGPAHDDAAELPPPLWSRPKIELEGKELSAAS